MLEVKVEDEPSYANMAPQMERICKITQDYASTFAYLSTSDQAEDVPRKAAAVALLLTVLRPPRAFSGSLGL